MIGEEKNFACACCEMRNELHNKHTMECVVVNRMQSKNDFSWTENEQASDPFMSTASKLSNVPPKSKKLADGDWFSQGSNGFVFTSWEKDNAWCDIGISSKNDNKLKATKQGDDLFSDANSFCSDLENPLWQSSDQNSKNNNNKLHRRNSALKKMSSVENSRLRKMRRDAKSKSRATEEWRRCERQEKTTLSSSRRVDSKKCRRPIAGKSLERKGCQEDTETDFSESSAQVSVSESIVSRSGHGHRRTKPSSELLRRNRRLDRATRKDSLSMDHSESEIIYADNLNLPGKTCQEDSETDQSESSAHVSVSESIDSRSGHGNRRTKPSSASLSKNKRLDRTTRKPTCLSMEHLKSERSDTDSLTPETSIADRIGRFEADSRKSSRQSDLVRKASAVSKRLGESSQSLNVPDTDAARNHIRRSDRRRSVSNSRSSKNAMAHQSLLGKDTTESAEETGETEIELLLETTKVKRPTRYSMVRSDSIREMNVNATALLNKEDAVVDRESNNNSVSTPKSLTELPDAPDLSEDVSIVKTEEHMSTRRRSTPGRLNNLVDVFETTSQPKDNSRCRRSSMIAIATESHNDKRQSREGSQTRRVQSGCEAASNAESASGRPSKLDSNGQSEPSLLDDAGASGLGRTASLRDVLASSKPTKSISTASVPDKLTKPKPKARESVSLPGEISPEDASPRKRTSLKRIRRIRTSQSGTSAPNDEESP